MSNMDLFANLKLAVAKEREVTTLVLHYLREVEDRKLHLEEGYPSMYAFCCHFLNYSEPEALVRIRAMRLVRQEPTVTQKIEDGSLSLTVAAQLQADLRKNEVSPEKRAALIEELTGVSTRAAEKILAREFPRQTPRERTRPINAELTEIRFAANQALMKKIERLKELMAHKNYSGRYDLLFEELANIALEKLEPKDDGPEEKPQTARTRYIPAKTRRHILARDGCEYVSPSGKRCGSRHGPQVDHRQEFFRGGDNAPENLRQLCGPHNRYVYEKSRDLARDELLHRDKHDPPDSREPSSEADS